MYYSCAQDHMPLATKLFGWITYSPFTRLALPGQLKVTFEDLRWEINCRADRAPMLRCELLQTITPAKRTELPQRCRIKLLPLHFSRPLEIFAFLIYAKMPRYMEKHCTGVWRSSILNAIRPQAAFFMGFWIIPIPQLRYIQTILSL